MKFLFPVLLVISFLFTHCNKNSSGDEAALYGTWVKGPNFGDTLWFTTRNNQNIMRMAESFNAGMPVYSEKEYKYGNGKLNIQSYAPASTEFRPIDSFTWTQMGAEFKIQGIQLFMFMSSTITYFTYHKVQ